MSGGKWKSHAGEAEIAVPGGLPWQGGVDLVGTVYSRKT
jgi:hypothetical protein